jgi:hypothetical protein
MNLEFSLERYWEITQIQNFMEIHPVEADSLHADGQTDRQDEANSRFSQFCERAKTQMNLRSKVSNDNDHNNENQRNHRKF